MPDDYAILDLDLAELTVRMIEAQTGGTRPHPDAKRSLDLTEPDFVRAGWLRAGLAAIRYFAERVQAASPDARYVEEPQEGTQH